jgi:hypothetical protein
VNNAVGSTPGVGILRVTRGGRSGSLQAVAPISHVVGGIETADPHGLAVRDRSEDSDDDCQDSDDDCGDSDDDGD